MPDRGSPSLLTIIVIAIMFYAIGVGLLLLLGLL